MHTNPDLLALLAIGENVAAEEDLVHIADCLHCRAELAAFTSAAGTVRRTSERDQLLAPRPEVWRQISHELGLGAVPSNGALASHDTLASNDTLASKGAIASHGALVSDRAVGRPSPSFPSVGLPRPAVAQTTDRRRVRLAAFVLAAALALAVGLGLGANLDRVLPGEREVASVPLNALPGFAGSSGRAVVEEDADGNRTLLVTITSPDSATGPREVWMTNTTAKPMIAMGYLVDGEGRFPIDPEIDLADFPLIDVSQEPADDHNFEHSGRSMLRGKLPV